MVSISRIGVFALAVSAFALAGTMASADQGTRTQLAAKPSADTKAADLRSALDQLLGEHVQLAADATNAALNGRDAEFQAAAGALDANSVDIANAIGSVYGKDAGEAFLGLWRSHIGMVVDYTVGTASKDKTKQDKAVGELMQYTKDFGAFLNSANPNLPQDAVADLVKHHAVTLKAVIDAQAAGDQQKAYMALRTAYGHMAMIAEALAQGIVKQFPKKFG
jgi:hypothetical protein